MNFIYLRISPLDFSNVLVSEWSWKRRKLEIQNQNKILTLNPHLWPIHRTTSYLSLSVLKMKTLVNVIKYKVFDRFKKKNGITIVINSKPDQICLAHTLMWQLKAIRSYQKVIIIHQLDREKDRRSTQLRDLSALQSAPRQAVHPDSESVLPCHHSTAPGPRWEPCTTSRLLLFLSYCL